MLAITQKLTRIIIISVAIATIALIPSMRLRLMPKTILWYMDAQRLLELLLLSLILLEAVISGFKQHTSPQAYQLPMTNKVRYAFFALLALAIASISLSQTPRLAAVEVTTFIGLCYLSLLVTRMLQENKEAFLKHLIIILWLSSLLYMVSFYVGYITAITFNTPLKWPQPFSGYSNIRHFNQYQLWGLGLLTLPLLAFNLPKNSRFWLNIALTGWWVLLFYSASRGVLLALLLASIITLLFYRKLAWPLIRTQFTHFIFAYFSYIVLFKIVPMLMEQVLVTGTIMRETTSDRFGLWKIAIDLIQKHPFLGVGPMHYVWHSPSSAHPHNSILQLASEWGLPATLIILSITSYGLLSWWKRYNYKQLGNKSELERDLSITLFFSLIANGIYSLFDGVIIMPLSQVMMFLTIGLMVGHYMQGNQIINSPGKPMFRSIFAGLALATMAWSVMPEIIQGLSGNSNGFSMGYFAEGPRFWREMRNY